MIIATSIIKFPVELWFEIHEHPAYEQFIGNVNTGRLEFTFREMNESELKTFIEIIKKISILENENEKKLESIYKESEKTYPF